MTETLNLALGVTIIGMGLVFAGILLLWGMLWLLVRLTGVSELEMAEGIAADDAAQERKRRAAAIGAAIALAMQKQEYTPHTPPPPPTPIISAWQAVLRTNQLNKRGMR